MRLLKQLFGNAAPLPVGEDLEAKLQAIDWYQFEKLITALFETEGHHVHHKGGAHPDGGIDLIVKTGEGAETLIQCKHWKAWNVGVRHIRELMGCMMASGIHAAIFITLRGYTGEAKELAAQHNIVILDGRDVLQMIREVKPDLRRKILGYLNATEKRCPKCESRMVLRTATKGENAGGKFWGCSTFPKCRYTLKVAGPT
jgi:restriction system protein